MLSTLSLSMVEECSTVPAPTLLVYQLTGIWFAPPFWATTSDTSVSAQVHRVFCFLFVCCYFLQISLLILSGLSPSSRTAPPWANSVYDYLEDFGLFAKWLPTFAFLFMCDCSHFTVVFCGSGEHPLGVNDEEDPSARLPVICNLWRSVYSDPLPIFNCAVSFY